MPPSRTDGALVAIREMREADLPQVAMLEQKWFEEESIVGYRPDTSDELLEKVRNWAYVAVDPAGLVIAFICGGIMHISSEEWAIFPGGGTLLNIEDLYVSAAWRRKGIGSALVNRLFEHAKANGVTHVAVYTSSKQHESVKRFYNWHGISVWYMQLFGSIE